MLAEAAGAGLAPGGELDTADTELDTAGNPGDEADEADEAGAEEVEELDDVGDEPPPRPLPGTPGTAEARGHDIPGSRAHGRSTPRKYDWTAIRRRYVEGVKTGETVDWPTLDAIAEHFGVSATRVREKSATEGWVGMRTQWQAQVEDTRRQARAAALARASVDVDNKALDAAKLGLTLINARLTEIGQAAQAARASAGPGGNSTAGTIDALEQARLAQAVDLWQKIGLRAIGDPETHRVELTGPGGQPIEIATELRRDDPTRLSGVLSVLRQAGLGDLFGSESSAGATLEAQRGADGVYSTQSPRS